MPTKLNLSKVEEDSLLKLGENLFLGINLLWNQSYSNLQDNALHHSLTETGTCFTGLNRPSMFHTQTSLLMSNTITEGWHWDVGSGGAFFVRDTRPVLLLLLLSGKFWVRAGGSWRTLGCRQYTVGPNSSCGARRNTDSEPLLTESGARSNHSTLFTLPGFSCFWLQVITVVPRPCCDWRLRGICTAHYQHRQETPKCYEQVEACALITMRT